MGSQLLKRMGIGVSDFSLALKSSFYHSQDEKTAEALIESQLRLLTSSSSPSGPVLLVVDNSEDAVVGPDSSQLCRLFRKVRGQGVY